MILIFQTARQSRGIGRIWFAEANGLRERKSSNRKA